MGCANSKDSKFRRCKKGPASPMRHSVTLYPRYHLEGGRDGDKSYVAARSSATLGHHEDLFVDAILRGFNRNDMEGEDEGERLVSEKYGFEEKSEDRFAVGIDEAKIWSSLMDERITKIVPKTPIRTPPGEPEIISLWDVMEGLEDMSPFIKPVRPGKSFSFDGACDPELVHDGHKSIFREDVNESHDMGQLAPNGFSHLNGTDLPEGTENESTCTELESEKCSPEPKWLEMSSDEKGSVPEFDPEIISMFRKSLEDLSPENQFYIKPKVPPTSGDDEYNDQWQALTAKKTFQSSKKDRVVVYFTSLRGIRKTYEDCFHVRMILKGLGVRVDEKDLSMHSGFKEELKELLGETYGGGGLPRVFIGKKYIGGADEIRRLHEEGELEKLVEGCEMLDISDNGGNTSCEACSDIRFIPCETCSGSCKIFYDYDDDEEITEEDDGFGFHRCPDCNENGLIRCPLCCD